MSSDSFSERTKAAQLQDLWSSEQGFSSLSYDPDDHIIQIYWHGPIPEPLLEQVDDAGRDGIEIVVNEANYTAAQLDAEAQRLADTFPMIRVISPRPTGDGLDVGVDPGAVADAKARGVNLEALFGQGIPVHLFGESSPEPV